MLLGRDPELTEIDRVLDRTRAGGGGALLIRGEAGIGKTALLAAARERASDMLVAVAAGVESEADLPFAALAELAAPFLGRVRELPRPQAQALEAALALAEPRAAGDRLAVFAGFVGLLRLASGERPVMVGVDDVQWLDSQSAECLAYLARRLQGSSVALMAAVRNGAEAIDVDGRTVRELSLEGLPEAEARALLASVTGEIAPSATEAILEAAVGNPLAIVELSRSLSEEQRLGQARIDLAPVPGTALWEAFEARIATLAEEGQTALLVAAASFDGELTPIVQACEELGVARESLDAPEGEGLVRLDRERLRFAHPLLRAVAYQRSTPANRRRAHAALAKHGSDDAAAWHLGAAALGPDEHAADALEQAAYRAAVRGAHGAAADALERAAAASSGGAGRARRLLAAALAAGLAGDYLRAAAMLDPVDSVEDPIVRGRIRHLLAMLTLNGGVRTPAENREMLVAEAREIEAADPTLAAIMLSDAGVSSVVAGNCPLALEAAEGASALLPNTAPAIARCQVDSMLGMALALRGRATDATSMLDHAVELLGEVDPVSPAAQSISFALHARLGLGGEEALRGEALSLISRGRDSGTVGLLPYYLLVAADAGYRLGAWKTAERELIEAIAIAEECTQRGPLSVALVVRARLDAARGEEEAARAGIERAMSLAAACGFGATALWGQAALGFLELSLGRVEEAAATLETASQLAGLAGIEDRLIVPWAPDLVEAYARAGRLGEAAELAADLGDWARGNGGSLALALAARCDGLSGHDLARERFEHALEHHQSAAQPFERARTLLAYGAWLHRSRRRVQARERLRVALQDFEALGATPWAERTRAELRAAGAIHRKPVYGTDELTAQELRIALAVARGQTNRQVAAELHLSPKTIEFHLGRVYRKLGIRSRTELATLVAQGALDPAGG